MIEPRDKMCDKLGFSSLSSRDAPDQTCWDKRNRLNEKSLQFVRAWALYIKATPASSSKCALRNIVCDIFLNWGAINHLNRVQAESAGKLKLTWRAWTWSSYDALCDVSTPMNRSTFKVGSSRAYPNHFPPSWSDISPDTTHPSNDSCYRGENCRHGEWSPSPGDNRKPDRLENFRDTRLWTNKLLSTAPRW